MPTRQKFVLFHALKTKVGTAACWLADGSEDMDSVARSSNLIFTNILYIKMDGTSGLKRVEDVEVQQITEQLKSIIWPVENEDHMYT